MSHSSRDMREAIALKQWLAEQDPPLTNEIFLDVDPDSGLRTGTRWKDALRHANARCEAVICLLSANWERSHECKVEYRTAENLNKQIFCARLEASTGDELTSEWQRCDLFGDGPKTRIDIGSGPPVELVTEGLYRLRDGIRGAGIGAESFVWPPPGDPDRAPYRGWEPLDEADAAVFFGRDAQIVRALDALRGMRRSEVNSLFVILGPSGTGKSSFLRAGLLPRLRREDRRFVLLDIVRPDRNALVGASGLASAVSTTRQAFGLGQPSLGEIKQACSSGDIAQVAGWLADVRAEAARRLLERGTDGTTASAPTLVLPLDQAEELFAEQGGAAAEDFLRLLAGVTETLNADDLGIIVAATIRTDRYEIMQTHPSLAGLGTVLFDELKPMPPTQFKEVITGPAQRATEAGRTLRVAPDLADRLLADAFDGADTLPILALTLSRLYTDYGSTGELTLANYEALGGMRRVVQTEIDEVLAADPQQREAQLAALRAAFVPWLATVNAANDQPMRRVARWSDLPEESRPLIDALVARRLMVRDIRDGQTVVEVALESLLRQWSELAGWLREQSRDLKAADDLERAALNWTAHGQDPAWLLEGTRLVDAEALIGKPDFRQRLSGTAAFVAASRAAENRELADEEAQRLTELRAAEQQAAHARERQENAEAHATTLRKRSRILRAVLALTAVVAVVAGIGFVRAYMANTDAQQQFRAATSQRLATEAQAMLADARPGGDIRALQELLAAQALAATPNPEAVYDAVADKAATAKIGDIAGAIPNAVAYSPDGRRLAVGYDDAIVRISDSETGQPTAKELTGSADLLDVAWSPDGKTVSSVGRDGSLELWDVESGTRVGEPLASGTGQDGRDNRLLAVAFSPTGRRIGTAGVDGRVELWDVDSRRVVGSLVGHTDDVYALEFSPNASRIATGSDDGTVRIWDAATGRPVGAPLAGHAGAVRAVAFSPDGTRLASGGSDATVRVWDVNAAKPVGPPMEGHTALVSAVAFADDGRMVSGSYDRTLRWWDVDSGTLAGQPLVAEGRVQSLAIRPGAAQLAAASGDGTLEVWNLVDVLPLKGVSAAFTSDGERLALGAADGYVTVHDPHSGRDLGRAGVAHPHSVVRLAYSGDGRYLVSGGFDGSVWIWNVEAGLPVGAPARQRTDGSVSAIGFSPDGRRFVVGSEDGVVRIGDAEAGQWTSRPLSAPGGAAAVSFTDDNEIVSVHADIAAPPTVRRWNATSGELLSTESIGLLTAAAAGPNGQLAAGTIDGLVTVYGADYKPITEPVSGHAGTVTAVDFDTDADRLASADEYGSIRVWNPATATPIGKPLGGQSSLVVNLAMDPDGRKLAAADIDGQVRLWPASASTADLCAKLVSNMSHRQWNDWVSPDIAYIATCPGLPIAPD